MSYTFKKTYSWRKLIRAIVNPQCVDYKDSFYNIDFEKVNID